MRAISSRIAVALSITCLLLAVPIVFLAQGSADASNATGALEFDVFGLESGVVAAMRVSTPNFGTFDTVKKIVSGLRPGDYEVQPLTTAGSKGVDHPAAGAIVTVRPGATSVADVYYDYVPDTTRTIPKSDSSVLSGPPDGVERLIISPGLLDIADHDILVSGATSQNPDGLIVEVTKIIPEKANFDKLIVHRASLGQAIPDGYLNLNDAVIESSSGSTAGDSFSSNLTNLSLPPRNFLGQGPECKSGSSGAPFSSQLIPDLSWSRKVPKALALTMTLKIDVEQGLTCRVKVTILRGRTRPIPFVVAGVPIVLTGEGHLDLVGSVTAKATISQTLKATYMLNIAKLRLPGHNRVAFHFGHTDFATGANGSASLGVEGKVGVLFYGTLGAFIRAGPEFLFNTSPKPDPSWILERCFVGRFGVSVIGKEFSPIKFKRCEKPPLSGKEQRPTTPTDSAGTIFS
jgi:hypothetical protein